MAKNLYVGNMSFSTTEDQLREVFAQYGTVTKVQLIMDRETGRPRGFAFVEMSDGGDQAIAALNGTQLDGRSLTVNEAKPREGGGGGGGGGRGGYGGGGGGGGSRGGYGGGGGGGGGRRY
ncbi:RNA recognition motif domain-containing protein [Frigoriglobus tundricola]|uniref:RNA-binding protein n=1 Tax=Frigoriglobus tundricola TaxID=2774151 RepID=A0A6M5YNA9_9BACT|nr:RNA-binding protein [Frigoriglobus tundricola]QJW95455.1 RNA-binding protein [Frigoriglobus tundricola]